MSRHAIKGVDDLETKYPELAREWHPTKNVTLHPSEVLPGSGKKVFWRCSKCNYEWEAQICNRAKLGRGCPCCANKIVVKGINDLATTHPKIAKEWYQPLNGDVTPDEVTYGCGKKYNWICPRGHIYSATVLHRTNGAGTRCPVCNSGRQTSFAEQALYYYVKQVFPSAINRYKDIFTKGMELDIYIPEVKIGIEYDGVYWHHKKETAYMREQRKHDICRDNGIELIRVREKRKLVNEKPPADVIFYLSTDKTYDDALSQVVVEVLNFIVSRANDNLGTNEPDLDIDIIRDRFEILSYLKGPVKNSIQEVAPELVNEWSDRNGKLKPDMISGGSAQSVFWVCSNCGFEWETSIRQRVKYHTGCPKCAGLIFEKGVNDLETKKPELILDWDFDVNSQNGIYPDEIVFNSNQKANWVCHKCGYQWSTPVRSRSVDGNGCIKCGYKAGKLLRHKKLLERQGAISDPLLLYEWDYERNKELGLFPDELTSGSAESVYWICSKCGYKWKAPVARRSNGAGCRKCADREIPNLKRKRLIEKGHVLNDKLLFDEWDYSKNTKDPQDYTYGSNEKVYWKCSKCGYEWCAAINSRYKGAGCPACAGNVVVSGKNDLLTLKQEIAKEWDYQKNSDVDPRRVSVSSSRKYWWICPEGHESYMATPAHRTAGTGCPVCGNLRIGEKTSKPVDQFTLDGTYIKTFKSVKAASEAFSLSSGAISNAIRKGTTSGGYRWRYHNEAHNG